MTAKTILIFIAVGIICVVGDLALQSINIIHYPTTNGGAISVNKKRSEVFAWYSSDKCETAPLQIGFDPYGSLNRSTYRLYRSSDERFAYLVQPSHATSVFPAAASQDSWANSIVAEQLRFRVDLPSCQAISTRQVSARQDLVDEIATDDADVAINGITWVVLYRTLDADAVEGLLLLPNLTSLTIGLQNVPSQGIEGLQKIRTLRRLDLSRSLVHTDSRSILKKLTQLDVLQINRDQNAKLRALAGGSTFPFSTEVRSPD
ncbi:hypothetical protein FF011L_04260 [Roseimaritima multifibrata]|uniref:Leucine Rich repeats (2 copies) n=1 Tax=Roseimaritima multifibrata TaxID=1930274 RepID=A0A517M9X5_9BACT|nr:hypothetical protein [Roseimaritima multifibrata]QDS91693.1 hypothetical protein FF011L_04260 [Roseimaritima multifibrata]